MKCDLTRLTWDKDALHWIYTEPTAKKIKNIVRLECELKLQIQLLLCWCGCVCMCVSVSVCVSGKWHLRSNPISHFMLYLLSACFSLFFCLIFFFFLYFIKYHSCWVRQGVSLPLAAPCPLKGVGYRCCNVEARHWVVFTCFSHLRLTAITPQPRYLRHACYSPPVSDKDFLFSLLQSISDILHVSLSIHIPAKENYCYTVYPLKSVITVTFAWVDICKHAHAVFHFALCTVNE